MMKSPDSPTRPVPFAHPQLLYEGTYGDGGEGVYSPPTPSISFSLSHTAPETPKTILMPELDRLAGKGSLTTTHTLV